MTYVYLPDTVSYITNGAFAGCSKLILNLAYDSYAKQYAINNSIEYIERERAVIVTGSCGANVTWTLYSDGNLVIQGTGNLSNPSMAAAVAWANYRSTIRSVDIAAGITNLPDFAFVDCTNLTSVTFEDGSKLTTIGGSAFSGCSSLKEINLPEHVKTIYGNAFRSCASLTYVYLPDTVSYITNSAFSGCDNVVVSVAYNSYAKQYAINSGIEYAERERAITASGSCGTDATWTLYSDGNLTIQGSGSLTNPSTAAAVAWANYRSIIRSVDIAAGITNLPDYAFFGCTNLTSVTFEDDSKLSTIGGSVFSACVFLKELSLPEHVNTIYGNAFRSCSSLTSLYLGDKMNYIADSILNGCPNVVLSVAEGSYAEQWAKEHGYEYTVRSASDSQEPDISGDGTEPTPNPEETSELPVEMPETPAPQANSCGSELTWKLENKVLEISGKGEMDSYSPNMAAPWAEYADEIEHIIIGKDVEKIGAYAFKGLEKMISVSFEDESKLTVIEEYAFADCKELTEIILPDKLEKLGEAAFTDCEKLTLG